MELKTYIAILWRRKWIILLSVAALTVAAVMVTLLTQPVYSSSTTLRVATVGGDVVENRTDINYSIRLMNTYVTIINSGAVRSQIRNELGLEQSPQINVEIIPDTELIRITAAASDPETARDVAQAAADILISKSIELFSGSGQTTRQILLRQLEQTEDELNALRAEYERLVIEDPEDINNLSAISQSIDLKERTYGTLLGQYEEARVNEAIRSNAISIIEPPFVPSNPSQPRQELNLALGIIVGLIVGVGLAFVFENLDSTLYTTGQIESATNLPTVGKIPYTQNAQHVIRFDNGYKPEVEAFRRLRTNILSSIKTDGTQSLLIASAESGEGKSTIAANLAVTMAQSGRRVIVVDCDMRQPTLHTIFDQPNKRGLTDILLGKLTLPETVQDTKYLRVELITSGSLPPNPTELLASPQMRELMEELKSQYDIILLDTPALLSVTDAAVLAPLVDVVVLVVARTRSNRQAVQAVRRELAHVSVKSAGVVVNRAEKNGAQGY